MSMSNPEAGEPTGVFACELTETPKDDPTQQHSSDEGYIHQHRDSSIPLRTPEETAAFHDLVVLHYDALVSYIAARLPTPSDAEDLVQIIFMRTWQSKKFDLLQARERGAWPWFHKSARNTLANYFRDRQTNSLVPIPTQDLQEDERHPILPRRPINLERDPHDITTLREEVQLIQDALGTLSERRRFALLLRARGMSMEDIAETLDTTVGAAKVLVHRAERQLAQTIDTDA